MKQELHVRMDAIKHEFEPLTGDLITTLHLELPPEVDLRFLQHVYRRWKDPVAAEAGEFALLVRDNGDVRRLRLESRGTKTKNFKVVAVMTLAFGTHHHFEPHLEQGRWGEPDPEMGLTLIAELHTVQPLIEEAIEKAASELPDDTTIEFSSGGKKITVGGGKGRKRGGHKA